MSNLPQFFLVHNSLNGWLPGARPVQEQPPQAAILFVRRDRGSRVRDRIGQCSPSNHCLTSASQGSCCDLPGKRGGPRGSRIGHHRLVFSRHTRGHDRPTHPVNPETTGFRNPRQLSTFTDSCAEPNILSLLLFRIIRWMSLEIPISVPAATHFASRSS